MPVLSQGQGGSKVSTIKNINIIPDKEKECLTNKSRIV